MIYVERDDQGKIVAIFDEAQENAHEQVSIDSEELLSFVRNSDNSKDSLTALSRSDLGLIRVLEDLIDTLIDKGVILFTDLPLAAREKIANREKFRSQLNSLDDLMGEDQGLL